MKHILIDTDVILDFYFDRVPFSENATKIIELCELEKIKGYVTPVIVANLYYMLRKNDTHNNTIIRLLRLTQFIEILTTDKQSIFNALQSEFTDFEDAIQNFSALKHKKISTIITRNTKDFKKSTLLQASRKKCR